MLANFTPARDWKARAAPATVVPGEAERFRLRRHSWTEGYGIAKGQPAADTPRNSRNNSSQPGLASVTSEPSARGVRKPHPPSERHRVGTQTSLQPHPQRDSCSEHRRYHCDKRCLDSRSLLPAAFSIPNSRSRLPSHASRLLRPALEHARRRSGGELGKQRRPWPRRHTVNSVQPPHRLTRPELCWATGRLSSCRISYLFPGQALMALTGGRRLQVSRGRHIPSQPCCSYSGRAPIKPGVLSVLASQIPCKRKTQT